MKLIEVILKEVEGEYRFVFEGEMEKDEDAAIGYSFSNIRIYEMVDDYLVPYTLSGKKTWAGVDIDEEYALADVISRYTRDTLSDAFLYVAPELKMALKPYMEDMGISPVHRISPKILYSSLMEEYTVTLVTDEYAYYHVGGDGYLMLQTATGDVVADNCFAECGYTESEEAVMERKEILLFQEYEFDLESYVKNTLTMVREKNLEEFSYHCMYGTYGEYETVFIKGSLNDGLATFNVERMKADGHLCSSIPVFEMVLMDKCIEKVAELAKENL